MGRTRSTRSTSFGSARSSSASSRPWTRYETPMNRGDLETIVYGKYSRKMLHHDPFLPLSSANHICHCVRDRLFHSPSNIALDLSGFLPSRAGGADLASACGYSGREGDDERGVRGRGAAAAGGCSCCKQQRPRCSHAPRRRWARVVLGSFLVVFSICPRSISLSK